MELNKTRIAGIVLVVVALLIFVIGGPIAEGHGSALAVSNDEGLRAQAELVQAQSQLSQGKAIMYDSLTNVLGQSSDVALQIAIGIAIVLLSIGVLLMLVSISHSVYVSGKIRILQAKSTYSNVQTGHLLDSRASDATGIIDGPSSHADSPVIDYGAGRVGKKSSSQPDHGQRRGGKHKTATNDHSARNHITNDSPVGEQGETIAERHAKTYRQAFGGNEEEIG
jgi:hypothetical protein